MEPIYKVDLSSIKDLPGASMTIQDRFELPDLNWEGDRLLEFVNPWHIELEVTNLKRGYQVYGKLGGSYRLACDRCLEEVQTNFQTELNELFLPEHAAAPEEEAQTYTGDELDLSTTLMEAVNLKMPMKILCSPTCRGLCPECGTNLNLKTCQCQPESYDPRLATLLKWKQDEGGGNDG